MPQTFDCGLRCHRKYKSGHGYLLSPRSAASPRSNRGAARHSNANAGWSCSDGQERDAASGWLAILASNPKPSPNLLEQLPLERLIGDVLAHSDLCGVDVHEPCDEAKLDKVIANRVSFRLQPNTSSANELSTIC